MRAVGLHSRRGGRRRLRSSARPAGFNNPDVSYDPPSPGTTPTITNAFYAGPVR